MNVIEERIVKEKYMKTSTSLELKIKMTMRHHFIHTVMVEMKKSETKHGSECGATKTHIRM